jgi:hypothetical protein
MKTFLDAAQRIITDDGVMMEKESGRGDEKRRIRAAFLLPNEIFGQKLERPSEPVPAYIQMNLLNE